MQLLRRIYCWERMAEDIQDYVSRCITCQRTKPRPHLLPLIEKKHPESAPFERVYMDMWGPTTWKDDEPPQQLLTILDNHTKWVEAEAIEDKRAETIANAFFTTWIARFGAPKTLVTDNESGFTSEFFGHLANNFGIRHVHTIPYHPQGSAPIESFHRTLKRNLKLIKMIAPGLLNYKEAVAWALFAYRSYPHSTTFDSPAYLTHGIDMRYNDYDATTLLPRPDPDNRLQILGEIRQELQRKQQLIQAAALNKENQNDKGKRRLFQLGDWVIREVLPSDPSHRMEGSAKVKPKWTSPLRVTARSADGYVGHLRCPLTGKRTISYVDKVKFINEPSTPGQKELWRQHLDTLEKQLDKEKGQPVTPDRAKRRRV